jgi:hypothetical protein
MTAPAGARDGHLRKRVAIRRDAGRSLRSVPLDIVTDRLDAPFDLAIATNILPYFDDEELSLAMANIASMIAADGVFLHNEARPLLGDLAAALDLPLAQSRHATIATVRGAAPLFDSVFLHQKPHNTPFPTPSAQWLFEAAGWTLRGQPRREATARMLDSATQIAGWEVGSGRSGPRSARVPARPARFPNHEIAVD